MKIEFLGFKGDFNRAEAYLVVSLVLFLATLFLTSFDKTIVTIGGLVHYAIYFSWSNATEFFKFRCPKCKSRKLVLLGLQEYKGDAPYCHHSCEECGTMSVELGSSLIDPNATKRNKKDDRQAFDATDEIPF